MTKQELEKYVGTYVSTKVSIPSDRRGERIPAFTTLFVKEVVGDQHLKLAWTGGIIAANQIHYTKLFLVRR